MDSFNKVMEKIARLTEKTFIRYYSYLKKGGFHGKCNCWFH